MELTPAELVVLGLVVEQPRHGYDLEQVIHERGVRQWTDIGFSSIYYLLAKLEQRGLIHAPQAPAGAKSRRVLHATAEGRAATARVSLALVEELRPVPHPMLVALMNLPLLGEQEYAEALRARLGQVNERLAAVRLAQQGQEPLPVAAREVFAYSLNLLEAERSWLAARVEGVPGGGED